MWWATNMARSMCWLQLVRWKEWKLLVRCIYSRRRSWKRHVDVACLAQWRFLSIQRSALKFDLPFSHWQVQSICWTVLLMNSLVVLILAISHMNYTTRSTQLWSLRINTETLNFMALLCKAHNFSIKKFRIRPLRPISWKAPILITQITILPSCLKSKYWTRNAKNVCYWSQSKDKNNFLRININLSLK